MRGRIVLAGVTGLVLLAGISAAAPPTETRYVAQLRQAAAQVEAARAKISSANKNDSAALRAVGQQLSAAAGAACQTLHAYQNADTRFGTGEEYQLVQKLSQQLSQARSSFAAVAGVTLSRPSVKQQSAAEQLVRELAASAVSNEIGGWIGDQQLADILMSGGIKEIKSGLRRELTRRIDAEARSLSQRALGMSLSLNTPLATQVKSQIDQAALRWLGRTLLRWDATGLAIQIVGVPLVRFLRSELKAALRDHKHVTERTNRTVVGFEARIADLQKLIASADSTSLDRVRRLLARAQHALDATLYLRSDLKKQNRNDLITRLAAAEAALKAKMSETRAVFLLDSSLARSNLAQLADDACRQQGEIVKITKKIVAGKPPSGGDPIVGDWRANRGVIRITQIASGSFEGRLISKLCEKSAKLGQVEVRLKKTATNQYAGTIRYLVVTSCQFVGEAATYSATIWPASASYPETFSICAKSPVKLGESTCEPWSRKK
jgi:hypothetical protein